MLASLDYAKRASGLASAGQPASQRRHPSIFRPAARQQPKAAVLRAASAGAHDLRLPQHLEKSRDGCLLQARIGFGESGRGLFFAPAVPALGAPGSAPREAPAAATAAGAGGSGRNGQTQREEPRRQPFWRMPERQQQQRSPLGGEGEEEEAGAVLLRVPLACGLTLVTGAGSVGLQRQLLAEWQSYNEVPLPERLIVLLEDTQRPPALRLAAWLLWVAHGAADAAVPPIGADAPCSEEQPSRPQPSQSHPPPAAATSAPAAAAGRVPLLAEYVRHILPPPTAGASCLRLADAEVARLPADAWAALQNLRSQVLSYIEEIRQAGLDWGFHDATLWWAFDMVASRSFAAAALLPPPPFPGGGDGVHCTTPSAATSDALPYLLTTPASSTAAPAAASSGDKEVSLALYMPWACLLNHSPSPNAAFRVDMGRRAFLVSSRHRWAGPSALLPPGQELSVSYGGELDNVHLFVKYGFCTAGNPNDRLPMPAEVASAARGLQRRALCSAAERVADGLATEVEGDGDGGAAGGGGGWEGSLEQRRTRVFTALASLLQPVVMPGESAAATAAGKGGNSSGNRTTDQTAGTGTSFAGLIAWSPRAVKESTSVGSELYGDSEVAAVPIPTPVQLSSSCACVDDLLGERRLIAASMCKILVAYCDYML